MLPVMLLAMAAAAYFGIDLVDITTYAGTPAKPKTETASTKGTHDKGSSLTGTASVVDGDTLDIHGERIRLVGVDAPESKQNCLSAAGQFERCGQKAANEL